MSPVEFVFFFGITLFTCLAALLAWKVRRNTIATRVNRGLRGYVATGHSVRQCEEPGEQEEELSIA
jgi:hypothetical protein